MSSKHVMGQRTPHTTVLEAMSRAIALLTGEVEDLKAELVEARSRVGERRESDALAAIAVARLRKIQRAHDQLNAIVVRFSGSAEREMLKALERLMHELIEEPCDGAPCSIDHEGENGEATS